MDSDLLALIDDSDTPNGVIADWLEEHRGVMDHAVYVVTGSTGEYSDHDTWNVAAFVRKELAEALCNRLTQWCKDNGAQGAQGISYQGITYERYPEDGAVALKPPEDPNFSCDYTGVWYSVIEIPLKG